jgi:hypothetical protein
VVERIPINKAINGLLVVDSIFSAKSPPKYFIPADSPLIPTRKRYNERTTPATFKNTSRFLFKQIKVLIKPPNLLHAVSII